MTLPITDPAALTAFLLALLAVVFGMSRIQRLRGLFEHAPPVLWCYFVPMLLSAAGVEFTSVAGAFALWFDEPHEVVVLAPDGTRRTETARLAGHTLIWEQADGTTLRLVGDLTRVRALEIAVSVAAAVP